eukprot:5952304-Pleurochrysis_carterae.AAC.1
MIIAAVSTFAAAATDIAATTAAAAAAARRGGPPPLPSPPSLPSPPRTELAGSATALFVVLIRAPALLDAHPSCRVADAFNAAKTPSAM